MTLYNYSMDNSLITRNELHNRVCNNIKKYRKEKRITREHFAEMIDISAQYVGELESPKGEKSFSFYTLYKISIALDIPIDKFLEE